MFQTTNQIRKVTLWLFNIAMENDPFIDGLPNLKIVIFQWEKDIYVFHHPSVILLVANKYFAT